MRDFDHATIFSPDFHGLRRERLAQWPPFCVLNAAKNSGGYFQKNWVGVCGTLPETLALFQNKICDFPCPMSDLIKNLIPYFRPEALEPGSCRERVTSCYGTYTVVGVNIKREWSYHQMMKKQLILLKNKPIEPIFGTTHPTGEGGGGGRRVADYGSRCLHKRD